MTVRRSCVRVFLELVSKIGFGKGTALAVPSKTAIDAATSAAEKLWNRQKGEGHEFYSCRRTRQINSGFQPLGERQRAKTLFPHPL